MTRTASVAAIPLVLMSAACSFEAQGPSAASRSVPVASLSSRTVATAPTETSAPPSPIATPGEGAGPGGVPLNPLEQRLIGALAEIGLAAGRIEVPFRGANLWVGRPDGDLIELSAVPLDADRGDFTATGTRQVAGLAVTSGSFGGDDRRADRFECDGIAYYVRGDLPDGFGSADDFLAALAGRIGCASN